MTDDATRTAPKPPPVDRMSLLWQRINEHKIVQWSAAYIAIAYGIQHGVVLTGEAFDWPHEVPRYSMLLLVLGLPIATTLAWYHGEPAGRRVSGPELTVIALLLVIASLLFYVFVRPTGEFSEDAPSLLGVVSVLLLTGALLFILVLRPPSDSAPFSGRQEPGAANHLRSFSTRTDISLAVLPFVNLSPDPDQEFFSDGMTEEITSVLAKVPKLRVVARTSSFQFKSQNRDIQSIGEALRVTHLIEGSVRKEANQVRITAQLIRADDGTHLWAESYDRELRGVFAVQEEIATAIASALRFPLGLKSGESLVVDRTLDTDSYQDYLRARALVRARGPFEPGGPLTDAAKLLEQVTARDPSYAPAWGLLGQAYALTPIFTAAFVNGSTDEYRQFTLELLPKAEAAALRATRLAPSNVDGCSAMAFVRNWRGEFVHAEDWYKKALALDPGNPDALNQYSIMLTALGRVKDSLVLRLRLQSQEPLVPVFNQITGDVLWENGRNEEALKTLKPLAATLLTRFYLAQVYAAMARYQDAADTLREIPSGFFPPKVIDEAAALLRNAPAKASGEDSHVSSGFLGFVYLYAGFPDKALDFLESLANAGAPALGNCPRWLWAPPYAPIRKTERFKVYVRKAGMLEYWKARGWPDLCHPVGPSDFACE